MTIDWVLIRRRWEAGESGHRISKVMGGRPTRQAIDQRAKREQWSRAGGLQGNGGEANPVVAATWLDRCRGMTPCGTLDTPERRAQILSLIANGLPLVHATKHAGIDDETFRAYRARDPQLQALVDQAQAEFVRSQVDCVTTAAQGGDANSAKWMLERHPESRETFRPSAKGGGPSVAIQINHGVDRRPAEVIEAGGDE